MKIEPNGEKPGAIITEIDLSHLAAGPELSALRAAVTRHGVVAIRGQHLSLDDFERFSTWFGPAEVPASTQYSVPGRPNIHIVSNIIGADGRPIGLTDAGQIWHTDSIFEPNPTMYSMLYAEEIPLGDDGEPLGSTWFLSAADAYDTLPEDMQARIAPLQAEHSLVQYRATMERMGAGGKRGPLSDELRQRRAVHPVVRTHPESGRKCLYISDGHTAGIVGMDPAEGRALVDVLQSYCVRDGRIYKHRWAVGDVVIWDNCSMQHMAIGDYGAERRRLLYRIATEGRTPT